MNDRTFQLSVRRVSNLTSSKSMYELTMIFRAAYNR